jgi:hypothetical protein
MFIYFSAEQVRSRDYRGPDFFVVKGVDGVAQGRIGPNAGRGRVEIRNYLYSSISNY